MEPAKLNHAKAFTATEQLTLTYWLRAIGAGYANDVGSGSLADRILETGLAAEHYESLLADDPAARETDETTLLASLQQAAKTARDELDAALASGGPVDRGHDRG